MARFAVGMLLFIGTIPLAAQERGTDEGNPLEQARRRIRQAVERIAIPRSRLTDGPHVRAAFRDVVADPSRATVRVESDGEDVAIGGIVGPDGWIITKASSVKQPLRVRLRDGREFPASVVGADEEYDLAMLKVDARQLPTLDLDYSTSPEVGQWVATVGPGRDPLAVGVVSVGPRAIPKQPGILGVQLTEDDQGRPLVVQVISDSGAARAGILVNDIVLAVNGEPTKTRQELVLAIRQFSPDEEVAVTVERDGQEKTIPATLTARVRTMRFDRGAYQNNLGGSLSRRRYGFPAVFQHDTVLVPTDCGGPLVDLEGRVIGFNIARAGRTESYAVPTAMVAKRLFDLMSGALAPVAETAGRNSDQQQRRLDTAETAAGGH